MHNVTDKTPDDMGASMRMALYVAIFVGGLLAGFEKPRSAVAAPTLGRLGFLGSVDHFELVEDTCWWWGMRWQYGWRGYGWYPCWDWVKPQPTVIAPEEVPVDALKGQQCVKSWRDPSGDWHTRRIC